jgi:hypothetical protein
MEEIVLRVRLIGGERLDVTYTASGGHGGRLVVLYGRGIATLEVAPRGAIV